MIHIASDSHRNELTGKVINVQSVRTVCCGPVNLTILSVLHEYVCVFFHVCADKSLAFANLW